MSGGPTRTCVGCRAKDAPDTMVRVVVAPDGQVVPDLRGKLPGRGAWVHLRPECLDAAPRGLGRALKGRVDSDGLRERIEQAVVGSLADGLSLAAAGGGLIGGRTVVEQALSEERARWVLFASDCAARTRKGVEERLGEVPMVVLPMTTDELGQRTGRAPRAVLAVLDASCSVHLRRQLRRIRSLG